MTKESLIEVERQAFQARFRMGDWDGNMVDEADVIAQKYSGPLESSIFVNAEKVPSNCLNNPDSAHFNAKA